MTAEVLDHSFTSAVSDSDHVECTSVLFTTVESDLSEIQVCSQFLHGADGDTHSIVMIITDSAV